MTLTDLALREPAPEPWKEGDNIPWSEPAFSARMLREHLSQEHSAASRQADTIDRQVEWVWQHVLGQRPARVLDLGCGPGLYTARLAKLGCQCVGIDYAPASIQYARDQACSEELACRYVLGDLRTTDLGDGFHLAMMLFGELNVFRPQDASRILSRCCRALEPGGMLLLEPHTFEAVRRTGCLGPTWHACASGLFADRPHLVLEESHWTEDVRAATTRFFVVDAVSGDVARYARTLQAYTDAAYTALLSSARFTEVRFCPSLTGAPAVPDDPLCVITARAP